MRAPGGIKLSPVRDRADLKRFIRASDAIYRDDPNWIRPLMFERLSLLDREKNPYFEHAEAQFWIAWRDGLPVGRISAQIDRMVEDRAGERVGHFGLFETTRDEAVSEALLAAAEAWLTERGCTLIQGPYSLSTNNGDCGLLVDGFDTPPAMMMGHARPWYGKMIERLGYRKAIDLYAYELDLLKGPPERITRFVDSSMRNPNYELRRLDFRRYHEDLQIVIDIFNDAWSKNWGFVPLTPAEARHMAAEIKLLIDPHCVQICYYKGEPMAMMVALGEVNSLIDDFNGSLLPFNWLKLLWRLKVRYPKRARVPLMGVRSELQGTRQGAAMALMLIESIRKACVGHGANWAELSWILEDNHGMRNILDEIGCRIYKTYRVYEKRPG